MAKRLLFMMFYLPLCLMGQTFEEDASLLEPDTILFELSASNNIIVTATLNQLDTLKLMFHTAANGISLIESVTVQLESIDFNHQDSVKSWGGGGEARFSQNNHLSIGNLSWDSLTIWENRFSGPGTDGKIGPDLFAHKAIEVDFETKRMVIHPQLPDTTSFFRAKIESNRGLLFVDGKLFVHNEVYENAFLIHSGYGGSLLLDDAFTNDHQIGAILEIIDEKELKDSYGNVLKTKKALLPQFKIGNTTLEEVPIGFFEGAIGRQKMSVMGGDLLKRFHLIFAPDRTALFLRGNELMNQPYNN